MATYKIQRWDPVVFGNNVKPFPMIYISPDDAFLKFAEMNNNSIFVKITDTDTIYDNHAMVGIVSSSYDKPRCTTNFYNKTGLITITLYGIWYQYPDKLGTATVSGLKGQWELPKESPPPMSAPLPIMETYENTYGNRDENRNETIGVGAGDIEGYNDDKGKDCPNLSSYQIGGIVAGIIVLFGVFLWISMSSNSKAKK